MFAVASASLAQPSLPLRGADVQPANGVGEIARRRFMELFDRVEASSKNFGAKRIDKDFHSKFHSGVVLHQNGNLIYCNRGLEQVEFYNPEGQLVHCINNTVEGHIREPSGVAVDSDGNILVVEARNNRISIFNAAGDFIKLLGEDSGLNNPSGLCIDPDGTIIVADTDNHQIVLFHPDQTVTRATNTFLYSPRDVAIHPLDHTIAVLDQNHIFFFDKKGNSIDFFSTRAPETDQLFPLPTHFLGTSGLTYDQSGNLFISERGLHHVQVYDKVNKYVCSFGLDTKLADASNFCPSGITVGKDGTLYVVNSLESRVLSLSPK